MKSTSATWCRGKYGSVSYKTKQKQAAPQGRMDTDRGDARADYRTGIMGARTENACRKGKALSIRKIGLFARKARCAECGYTLRSSKTKGNYYLQCPNHHISKESCRGAFISVERLERMVLQELHTISDAYLNWEELERQLDFCSHLKEQRASLQKKHPHP